MYTKIRNSRLYSIVHIGGDDVKNITVHDFIVPTNPIVALMFGCIITIIVSVIVYVQTKELKVALYTTLITFGFLVLFVWILYVIGFYN